MYCSACGQPMDPSQTMCQRCGRPIAPIASYAPVAYERNRVHRHMQALAVLWIAYSLWILLHWAIAVGVLAGAFTNWGHHSHAFEALEKHAKRPSLRQYDAECIVCHTVGFGYKTGYEDDKKTPQLLHVGCESCHGPGSGHAADPKNKALLALQSPWKQNPDEKLPDTKFMKKMADLNGIERGQQQIPPATLRLLNKTNEMCQRCHNHENDPNFDLYTNWPKIDHTAPAPAKN